MTKPTEAYKAEHVAALLPNIELRDWFAGQALMGIVASRPAIYSSASDAATAYKMADAMLAERKEPPK